MPSLDYVSASKFKAAIDRASLGDDQIVISPIHGLCLGSNPLAPRLKFDFDAEAFVALAPLLQSPAERDTSMRKTGSFEVTIHGHKFSFNSLKALLSGTLRQLEKTAPGTLQELSKTKARTRRIVARNKEDLFDAPHLAESHAELLIDGWFVNTNNNKEQVKRWLELATSAARLNWGRDVVATL